MKQFLLIAMLAMAASPLRSLASTGLEQRAANAFALSQCNLDRTKRSSLGEAMDEIKTQFKAAGIKGSPALESLITGGKGPFAHPSTSFVQTIYRSMESSCPNIIKAQGSKISLENIDATLLTTGFVFSWSQPDLGYGYEIASQENRSTPSTFNNAQVHQLCKDARDYEGYVKVKSGNSQTTARLDRFGRPAMGANFVKFSSKDRDLYIHKTSAKSLEVRNSYGRYVSVNIAVKGIGDSGYSEDWATVRYDCDEKTTSLDFKKLRFQSEWEKKNSWFTPWIEKNLCTNPAGFPKAKFIR